MKLTSTHFRLSFNEANILMGSIAGSDKPTLIIKLQELSENTPDEHLKLSATQLQEKLSKLSETEFSVLQADAAAGRVLYPPGYMLGY